MYGTLCIVALFIQRSFTVYRTKQDIEQQTKKVKVKMKAK